MIANILKADITHKLMFVFLAVATLVLVSVVPAFAQGVTAGDLADPVRTQAQNAVIAGFGIAVVMLAAMVIYRAVRRFLG